jgi:molecular chaperone GrpE
VIMAQSMTNEAARNEPTDVAALEAENASLRDRMLRALADAENTRRRAERTAEGVRQYAISDFARELLAIADNLQRSIAAAENRAPERNQDDALVEGVRATLRMLEHTLQRFGVRKMQPLGTPFDPALHEAMMEVDDRSQPPGTVARVDEDGYMIHDRLLRPARVAVTKQQSAETPQPDASAPPGEPDSRSSARST